MSAFRLILELNHTIEKSKMKYPGIELPEEIKKLTQGEKNLVWAGLLSSIAVSLTRFIIDNVMKGDKLDKEAKVRAAANTYADALVALYFVSGFEKANYIIYDADDFDADDLPRRYFPPEFFEMDIDKALKFILDYVNLFDKKIEQFGYKASNETRLYMLKLLADEMEYIPLSLVLNVLYYSLVVEPSVFFVEVIPDCMGLIKENITRDVFNEYINAFMIMLGIKNLIYKKYEIKFNKSQDLKN